IMKRPGASRQAEIANIAPESGDAQGPDFMIAALRAARLGWHGIDRRIAARASRGGRFTVFAHELFWPADAPLGRYDFVTLMAVAVQLVLLASGLETRREAAVIVLFHVTGTLM